MADPDILNVMFKVPSYTLHKFYLVTPGYSRALQAQGNPKYPESLYENKERK
jgi:hypothetical protein